MTDPISATTGVVQAVPAALTLSRSALRRLRLFGTVDVPWLEIDPLRDWLTATDVSDIEDFLRHRSTRALLSMLATTLLTSASDARKYALKYMADTFKELATRWRVDHSSRWVDRQDAVWSQIVRIYDRATPTGKALADAAAEYTEFISTPLGRQTKDDQKDGGAARYIERIVELCSDIVKVSAAIDLADALREAISDAPVAPIITYTTTTKTATFHDLYVSRTLVDSETDEELSTVPLSKGGAPYRAVLHGAPGAGKSTFVRNLRQEMAAGDDGQAALIITVRGYFSTGSTQTVVEHLHSTTRATLNLEFDTATLRDALTLGLIVVVFDGLDEITDINLRLEMVERIASFAREYPAASILVTSRSVGYERAPLPSGIFRTLVLDQYDEAQSREYVHRWFGFIERPELVAEFERESHSVLDLKANPLLLSLLCVLYRERGSIPRRRRDIYAECADLLFHTWDSHRHINQPEELHANGDRIMQEIARWVYTSQKAQNGLPESVIQKTIGIYLRDSVGVEDGEARRRAGEFLEFCATRAWLLGTMGTEHGERVFGFTHRTFFEYFTAEAFSRSNSDPQKIAELLLQAHKRDATSVLPELLLQSFDQKVERGAADAFRHVCELTDDESLILRLMEGVPLPTKTRAIGFDRMLDLWESKKLVSGATFVQLLAINTDARSQFQRDYLTEANPRASALFLGAWAALDFASNAARHRDYWIESVERLGIGVQPSARSWFATGVDAWRWRNGYSVLPAKHPLLVSSTASGSRIGFVWLGLELAAEAGKEAPELAELFDEANSAAKRRKPKVGTLTAHQFARALALRRDAVPLLEAAPASVGTAIEWAYLFNIAVLYEAIQSDEDEIDEFAEMITPRARAMWEARAHAGSSDRTRRRGQADQLEGLPAWLEEWAKGKRAFVGDPRDEAEWDHGEEFG